MVKRRQQSPHTNVAQVRVMVSTPHVGSACPTLRGFSLGTLVYPSPQKPTFQMNATVSRQLFYPYKQTWRKKEQEAHTAKCFFMQCPAPHFLIFLRIYVTSHMNMFLTNKCTASKWMRNG